MTVKRRFKTLMMRKKKRQADAAQKEKTCERDESETNGASRDDTSCLEKDGGLITGLPEVGEPSTGQIDLNCHPNREDVQVDVPGLSMTNHLGTTNYLS